MTISNNAPAVTASRRHLEATLATLCRERASVSAELIEARREGDLENNDDHHQSAGRLDTLDTQIARLYTALSTPAVPLGGDEGRMQVGSVVDSRAAIPG